MRGVRQRDGNAVALAWRHEVINLGIQADADNCGLHAALTAAVALRHGVAAVWGLATLPGPVVALLRSQMARADEDAGIEREARLNDAIKAKIAELAARGPSSADDAGGDFEVIALD